MPAMKSAPTFTRYEPLWRALGWSQDKRGQRSYWLMVGDTVRRFRSLEMCGYGFLAEIYADANHWRRQFPLGLGHGIDTKAAHACFIRACQEAGEYDPGSNCGIK